jgi:hypothetical protein
LNFDIEGFFPALNFGRVRGFFVTNNNFALHPNVATVLAQISCHENALPQGSPCSPIISDLIGHILDMRFLSLMKKHKCTYSRYADDITISTNLTAFPERIAYQLTPTASAWILGDDVLEAVCRAGFSINHKKTRMQYRGSRQLVTGLCVNEKVNIRSDYYAKTRSMCHALFKSGTYLKPGKPGSTIGTPAPGNMFALEGILNHIYYVKKQELARQKAGGSATSKPPLRFKDRHGIDRLYGRFLFYKKFVAQEKPTIIAEGKTDNVYMKAAIKSLGTYHHILRKTVGGVTSNNVTFFKH